MRVPRLAVRVPIFAALAGLLCATPTRADSIVYNTFGPGENPYTITGYGFGSNRSVAVQFTADQSGWLTLAELSLNRTASAPDRPFAVSISADSGNAPGTVLETWSVPLSSVSVLTSAQPPIILPAPLELVPSVSPFLAAGTSYWLVVSTAADFSPPLNPSMRWGLAGIVDEHFILSSIDGGPAFVVRPGTPPGFRLTADATPPVPEPGTVSLVALGLAGLVRMARRRRMVRG